MNTISPNAKIYGKVKIGDNCRIDDFVILTGDIKIGNNVHISAYSFFSGGNGIVIKDFAQFAPRTTILTASDDYSGDSLVGTQIPVQFKPKLKRGKVVIGKHVLIGTNSTVMPGVTIEKGCSVGAYSFINKDLKAWGIYAGIPAKFIKKRSKVILGLEQDFIKWRKK